MKAVLYAGLEVGKKECQYGTLTLPLFSLLSLCVLFLFWGPFPQITGGVLSAPLLGLDRV